MKKKFYLKALNFNDNGVTMLLQELDKDKKVISSAALQNIPAKDAEGFKQGKTYELTLSEVK